MSEQEEGRKEGRKEKEGKEEGRKEGRKEKDARRRDGLILMTAYLSKAITNTNI